MSSQVRSNPPRRGDGPGVTSDSMNETLRTVIYLGCRIVRAYQDKARVYFKLVRERLYLETIDIP
jgi:hypothetical protein